MPAHQLRRNAMRRVLLIYEHGFSSWKIDENGLLAPSVSDFVPGDHPANFIRDLVSYLFSPGISRSEFCLNLSG